MSIDVSGAPIRRLSDVGKTGVNWQPGLDRQNPGRSVAYPSGGGGGTAIEIHVSGPMFDGRIRGLVRAMVEQMKFQIAAQVLADWHLNMDQSFQHPTPYYETQVTVERAGEDWVVHDRGIAYGNWLEGTSSRNATTQFKGYASLRRAVEIVRRHKAQQIAQRIANDYGPRFHG